MVKVARAVPGITSTALLVTHCIASSYVVQAAPGEAGDPCGYRRRCRLVQIASGLVSLETLEQLDLPSVVEVMGGDPVDVLGVGPLRFRRVGVQTVGSEPGDRFS